MTFLFSDEQVPEATEVKLAENLILGSVGVSARDLEVQHVMRAGHRPIPVPIRVNASHDLGAKAQGGQGRGPFGPTLVVHAADRSPYIV